LSLEDAERAITVYKLFPVQHHVIEPVFRYWQQKREQLGKELIIRLRVCTDLTCRMLDRLILTIQTMHARVFVETSRSSESVTVSGVSTTRPRERKKGIAPLAAALIAMHICL
jgi:hypothetical protein